jgi:hypothetical protein
VEEEPVFDHTCTRRKMHKKTRVRLAVGIQDVLTGREEFFGKGRFKTS